MAKRKVKAVEIVELDKTPCEYANEELSKLGYNTHITPEIYGALMEFREVPVQDPNIREWLVRLDTMAGDLVNKKYGEHTIRKACLTCSSSFRNILSVIHKPILLILSVCDKYAPKE